MAIKIFDNYINKDSNSVEFYISKIMPKKDFRTSNEAVEFMTDAIKEYLREV